MGARHEVLGQRGPLSKRQFSVELSVNLPEPLLVPPRSAYGAFP
jgi:hypothetical protein